MWNCKYYTTGQGVSIANLQYNHEDITTPVMILRSINIEYLNMTTEIIIIQRITSNRVMRKRSFS